MASEAAVHELQEELKAIIRYQDVELMRRPAWGEITFEIAQQDVDLARSIANDLSVMPLTYLTDQAAQEIIAHIPSVAIYFKQIDNFKLEFASVDNRNVIAANLKEAVAALHSATSHWIPYLAYKRGDFSEKIRKLETSLADAKSLLDEAETYAKGKQNEVDKIAEAAREASASAGAAAFTHEFDKEARRLVVVSRWWLFVVALFAASTVAAAVVSFFWPPLPDDASSWATLRHVVAKVSVIAVLLTGTVWCGRIYRAIRHQSSINRHRALSLRTFRAFVQATDDPATRDAVLMATTRSIFANVPTGLVDERSASQDASVNVLEIGKSAGKAVPTSRTASPES